MSLDISIICPNCGGEVVDLNITHNLTGMAEALKCYNWIWHAGDYVKTAEQLIEPVEYALSELYYKREKYKQYESPNGWGTMSGFIDFLEELLYGCKICRNGTVMVYR